MDKIIQTMMDSGDFCNATWLIAKRAGLPPRVVYNELRKLERKCVVHRYEPWCTSNNVFWKLSEQSATTPAAAPERGTQQENDNG